MYVCVWIDNPTGGWAYIFEPLEHMQELKDYRNRIMVRSNPSLGFFFMAKALEKYTKSQRHIEFKQYGYIQFFVVAFFSIIFYSIVLIDNFRHVRVREYIWHAATMDWENWNWRNISNDNFFLTTKHSVCTRIQFFFFDMIMKMTMI